MRWRGMFSGVLVLTALQAVVSSPAAAGRFGGMVTGLASIVEHALSPFEPAIPDLRHRKKTPPPPDKEWKPVPRPGIRPDAPAVPTQPGNGVLA